MNRALGDGERLLIGNLDCERAFATAGGGAGTPARRRALFHLSLLATLMRALAREGDRLWTPLPVPEESLADVPPLPRPTLVSGALERVPAPEALLAWGETREVASLRTRRLPGRALERPDESLALADLLWRLPASSPEAAARANHRSFVLPLRERLECSLPGTRWIRSPTELERHLRSGGASRSPSGRWVVKAGHSAAGRERLIAGGAVPTAAEERHLARLLAEHGELLFEPWMPRHLDLGVSGLVGTAGTRLLGIHEQEVDAQGRCRAIRLLPDEQQRARLSEAIATRLDDAARAAGDALHAAGYRGPFGIDAWCHRTGDDASALEPLGEVNARLTLGLLARVLRERGFDAGDPRAAFELRIAPAHGTGGNAECVAPGATALVYSPRERRPIAWVQNSAAHTSGEGAAGRYDILPVRVRDS